MLEYVTEAAAGKLATHADAIFLMRNVFRSLEEKQSTTFPSARGHGSDMATRFGVKLGFDGVSRVPGIKVGTYWPSNATRGLSNHGSTTLLLDDATGRVIALVEATWLNGIRTAAADAVATDLLARPDAASLAVFGTGNQAYHEVRALALVRRLTDIRIVGRNPQRAEALARRLRDDKLPVRVAGAEDALNGADIVVTATSAKEALFDDSWIAPGTHISAMGADGPGKQELPPALAHRASLFADDPAQSREIGEFQYLSASSKGDEIKTIGSVLCLTSKGRMDNDHITIFDSSGIGLQDVAIANLILERARNARVASQIEL